MYPYQQGFNNLQQQQQPLLSQQTGYNMNPQQTAFMQSQPTGYNFQQQQQQQQAFQPQQTGAFGNNFSAGTGGFQQLNPQLTGYYPQQQSLSFQQTGMPPSSFGAAQPQQQQQGEVENTELKIPNVRISFITLEDQKKFEHLFRISVPKGENAIDGATARDILMKSNLSANQLAEIWALSDTTKSGKLLFPEFALALHLCNIVLRGESLPFELPQSMKSEITNFVDNINFYVPENGNSSSSQPLPSQPQSTGFAQGNQTGFNGALNLQQTGYTPALQQQPTGFNGSSLQQQPTGFNAPSLQPQLTGFNNIQQQPTGFNNGLMQPQQTGFTGGSFLPSQPTGFQAGPLPQTSFGAPAPSLNPQRTGGALAPQQTGFTSVLTNQTGIMPQQTGLVPQATGFSTLPPMPTGPLVPQKTGGLTNFFNTATEAPVLKSTEWAITQQERKTFEQIFKNISQQGYISGQQAIQVLSKSGLGRPDLEKIWNLSDINNRGRLNKDEFTVAMHLIYRRLSGLDIPNYLPAELVPPSTKVLDDVKFSLKNQSNFGKKPSKINSSVSNNFKNDDNNSDIYVSRNRRKTNGGISERAEDTTESSEATISHLKKSIQEKKILLSAIDARDDDRSKDSYAQQKQKNEIETLKVKIKDAHTKLNSSSSGSSMEQKQQLLSRLRAATDKLPSLMSQLVAVDNQIRNAKIDLFKAKLQKESPSIKFFGSEEERARAKSRFLIKQRMASLTGKPAPSLEGFEDGEARLEAENEKVNKETENQVSIMKEIENSIRGIAEGVSGQLETSNSDQVGFEKYEKGEGLSSLEVKQFIEMLKAIKPQVVKPLQAPQQQNFASNQYSSRTSSSSSIVSPQGTGVDRAAYIKQQAQERMNARLAKLGIKRGGQAPASPVAQSLPANVAPASPTPKKKEAAPPPPPPAKRNSSTFGSAPPSLVPVSAPPAEVPHEEEEDDEELSRLLAEKARLEEEEKEKQRKRAERKAEIARLKAEMEALKNKEEEKSDEETEETPAKTEAPSAPVQVKAPVASETQPPPATHAANNPFFKPGTTDPISQQTTPVTQKGNPFFKPDVSRTSSASQVPAFDKDAAEAQRRAQRGQSNGNDDDDDWGDEASDEDEEDAIPLRGPAHLASLLFGGGGAAVSSPAPQVASTSKPETELPARAIVTPSNGDTTNNTDLDDEFATPPSTSGTPVTQELLSPLLVSSAPIPPPIPEVSEPASQAVSPPPIPTGYAPEQSAAPVAPPLPNTAAPPPPPFPNGSSDSAPPPPPLPNGFAPPIPGASSSAPPPPPLPNTAAPPPPPLPNSSAPPPPPPSFLSDESSAPAPPLPASGGLSALLGQIQGGKSLRKVSASEKHHADGATVGRVI